MDQIGDITNYSFFNLYDFIFYSVLASLFHYKNTKAKCVWVHQYLSTVGSKGCGVTCLSAAEDKDRVTRKLAVQETRVFPNQKFH